MKKYPYLFLVGLFLFVGAGCTQEPLPSDLASEESQTQEVSVVGTWTLKFWDDRYPDTPITSIGTFYEDGTAKTNYPAHYTIKGNTITVTADNGTTTSTGTIEDENTITGTWTYPDRGTSGTWEGVRQE
ncbi:hypothetical protein EPN81_00695 [Patescibacteria group bacterium]|nr:MAG: hypothetical protein EPN81_00695 [Patescibacteria group bacterium]